MPMISFQVLLFDVARTASPVFKAAHRRIRSLRLLDKNLVFIPMAAYAFRPSCWPLAQDPLNGPSRGTADFVSRRDYDATWRAWRRNWLETQWSVRSRRSWLSGPTLLSIRYSRVQLSLLRKLSKAELLIVVGLELSIGLALPPLSRQSSNSEDSIRCRVFRLFPVLARILRNCLSRPPSAR